MMINIRMTNGIRIQQRNLIYQNLKRLTEKLEGLCWMLQEWTDSTICVIFMICAVNMNEYYPSFTSSWTENHGKMKFSLSCLNYIYLHYLNDGRYNIDYSMAARFIRPLANERKNSLFFVSSRMANISATYHTLLPTCRMNGLSALEYLKKFFHEIV